MTLVEILVAITILAIGLIGTAGGIALYVKQQVVERSQVNANHLADSWFEYAESLERGTGTEATSAGNATNIAPISVTTTTTTKVSGVTFTEKTTPSFCTPTQLNTTNFNLSSCGGGYAPGDTTYDTILITWKLGGNSHQLTQTRNLADNSVYTANPTTSPASNALSNCTRAGSSASGTLSILTPSNNGPGPGANVRTDLDVSNHPIVSGGSVVLQLSTTGMVDSVLAGGFGPATCVPLFWTDNVVTSPASSQTHQVDMHTTPANCPINQSNYPSQPCIYTASVPTSAITQAVAGPTWDGSVTFTAHLIDAATGPPAVTAVNRSVSFYIDGPPTFSSCTAKPAGIILGVTLGGSAIQPGAQANIFSGTGTNMAAGTQITMTYTVSTSPTVLGTFTLIPSANSTAWTLVTAPSSVSYSMTVAKNGISPAPKNGGALLVALAFNNPFTFTATRTSDGKTATCTPAAGLTVPAGDIAVFGG